MAVPDAALLRGSGTKRDEASSSAAAPATEAVERPSKKAAPPARVASVTLVVAGLDIVEEGTEDINTKDLSTVPVEDISEAKANELTKMDEFGAYAVIPKEARGSAKHISTKWEIVVRHGVVKARFVCREFNTYQSFDFFAATSSSLAGRFIDGWILEHDLCAFILDASSAFLHVPEHENVVVDPPEEWLDAHVANGGSRDVYWRMLKTLYGRRSAAKAWTEWLADALVAMGLEQNTAMPTLFRAEGNSKLRLLTHMDDGYGGATAEETLAFKAEFGKRVVNKFQGPMSVGSRFSFLGCEREMWEKAIVIRPSDKYIERYLKMFGITNCKPVKTNYAEPDWSPENNEPVTAAEHRLFRAAVGLAQHLGLCRCDILYTLKELGRYLEAPTKGMLKAAKHLGRYLAGTKDACVVLHHHGVRDSRVPRVLNIITDANWANCRRTRKSTHCIHISLGSMGPLVTRAATQSVIAMSSGESEWYGGVAGACDGLLMAEVMKWMGWHLVAKLSLDSSAARGMAQKVGVAKMRTVELRTLWLQSKVKKRLVSVHAVPGTKNVADIGTKGLSAERLTLLAVHAGLVRLARGTPPQAGHDCFLHDV